MHWNCMSNVIMLRVSWAPNTQSIAVGADNYGVPDLAAKAVTTCLAAHVLGIFFIAFLKTTTYADYQQIAFIFKFTITLLF